MVQFLNRFSKDAQKFDEKEVEKCRQVFEDFLTVCETINPKEFLTKTGSFNVSLFDSVFVVIANRIILSCVDASKISSEAFDSLKNDVSFKTAITHSTSHADSVKNRLSLARKYLYGIVDSELSGEREDGK